MATKRRGTRNQAQLFREADPTTAQSEHYRYWVDSDWRLDAATKEIGRRGVQQAREQLAAGDPDPQPPQIIEAARPTDEQAQLGLEHIQRLRAQHQIGASNVENN